MVVRGPLSGNPFERKTPSRLETLIRPNPLDPPLESPIPESCIPAEQEPEPNVCLSVYLCLEGQEVDENCRCRWSTGSEPPPASNDQCLALRCSEGFVCDSNTGTCVDPGGEFEPAIPIGPNPIPIVVSPLRDPILLERMRRFGRATELLEREARDRNRCVPPRCGDPR